MDWWPSQRRGGLVGVQEDVLTVGSGDVAMESMLLWFVLKNTSTSQEKTRFGVLGGSRFEEVLTHS